MPYVGRDAASFTTVVDVTVSDDLTVTDDATIGGTALVTGVLTTTAATVFNGGFASNATSTITDGTSFSAGLTVENTGDTHGSVIDFFNNSSSPADGDYIGGLKFKETNSAGGSHLYAKIFGIATDVTDGSEDGALTFETSAGGANTGERMRITSAGLVGIGTTAPAEMLEIYNATSPAIQLNDGGDYKSIFRLAGNDLEIRGSSGSMEFYTGNADGDSSTEHMRIHATGAVTKPLQPAFQGQASELNDIAANTTNVTVPFSEVFDQNADFASNTFTAPVTGKYQLNAHILLQNVDSAATYYQLQIITSNRIYYHTVDPDYGQDNAYLVLSTSALADMDASDTATVIIIQSGGTAQTDVNTTTSKFSGFLAC